MGLTSQDMVDLVVSLTIRLLLSGRIAEQAPLTFAHGARICSKKPRDSADCQRQRRDSQHVDGHIHYDGTPDPGRLCGDGAIAGQRLLGDVAGRCHSIWKKCVEHWKAGT